jgi:hypothetical protein
MAIDLTFSASIANTPLAGTNNGTGNTEIDSTRATK